MEFAISHHCYQNKLRGKTERLRTSYVAVHRNNRRYTALGFCTYAVRRPIRVLAAKYADKSVGNQPYCPNVHILAAELAVVISLTLIRMLTVK